VEKPTNLLQHTDAGFTENGVAAPWVPGGYLSTVKHTALAGIKPITFRLLVRRATSLVLRRPSNAL